MLLKLTLTAAALALSFGAAHARSLEEAKASGKLIVGIQADNCPWGCLGSTGEAQGFDAEIARAFAAHLGLEAEFVPMAVANRIPALTTDKVDVLFATMAMNPERAQSIQFSVPYAANQLSLVGPKEADMSTPEKLVDYRIGVPREGAWRELLNSDAAIYGGSNLGNGGGRRTAPLTSHGYPDSLELDLPPLSVLVLRHQASA